ncbi:MAG TPA: zinc ribbon domain-containing protein, partial [Pyrinomonadaceae bacterium]|nr:zinc ribbon domain-containing protein [Pyrinomonadaceae bacterium]
CSSCGAAVPKDLSYCNHCGARLNGANVEDASKPAELFPEALVWAIVSVFVVGIGSVIGLIAVMKNYRLNDGLVLAFASLILVMMLAIEGVFIGLLLSRKKGNEQMRDPERLDGRRQQQTTNELEAAKPRALPEPVASVTEHTTRAFEPIYRDQKTE